MRFNHEPHSKKKFHNRKHVYRKMNNSSCNYPNAHIFYFGYQRQWIGSEMVSKIYVSFEIFLANILKVAICCRVQIENFWFFSIEPWKTDETFRLVSCCLRQKLHISIYIDIWYRGEGDEGSTLQNCLHTIEFISPFRYRVADKWVRGKLPTCRDSSIECEFSTVTFFPATPRKESYMWR